MKKITILILFSIYVKIYSVTELTFHQDLIYTNNLFYNSSNINDMIWLNSFNLDYEKNNLLISVNPNLFLLYNSPNYKNYKILSYLNYILNDNQKIYSDISAAYTINNFMENATYNVNEYYLSLSNIFYLKNNNKIELNFDYIKEIFKNLDFLNNTELNFSSSFYTKYKNNNFIFELILGKKIFPKYKIATPGHKNNKYINSDISINKLKLDFEYVKSINFTSSISIKYSKNIISNKYTIWPSLYNNLYSSQEWDDDFASNFDKITLKYNFIKLFYNSLKIEYYNKQYNQIKLFNKNQIRDTWQRKDKKFIITYNLAKELIIFNKESFINLKTLFFKNTSNIDLFNYNNFEIKLSFSIKLL